MHCFFFLEYHHQILLGREVGELSRALYKVIKICDIFVFFHIFRDELWELLQDVSLVCFHCSFTAVKKNKKKCQWPVKASNEMIIIIAITFTPPSLYGSSYQQEFSKSRPCDYFQVVASALLDSTILGEAKNFQKFQRTLFFYINMLLKVVFALWFMIPSYYNTGKPHGN